MKKGKPLEKINKKKNCTKIFALQHKLELPTLQLMNSLFINEACGILLKKLKRENLKK